MTSGPGLDPIALGTQIAVEARDELPLVAVAVHVPRGDELTPLVSAAELRVGRPDDPRARGRAGVGVRARPRSTGRCSRSRCAPTWATWPSCAGILPAGIDPARLRPARHGWRHCGRDWPRPPSTSTPRCCSRRLRDAATAEERRRLAREMHDGVAQDIASLGYLVDALAATPTTDVQAEGLRELRERITAVVAEVRRSVRRCAPTSAPARASGAAISGLARHLERELRHPDPGDRQRADARLRPEVESELLRIAQEAMNNAVKHAQRRRRSTSSVPGRRARAPRSWSATTARDSGLAGTTPTASKIMQRASEPDRRGPRDRRRPSPAAPWSGCAFRRRPAPPPAAERRPDKVSA